MASDQPLIVAGAKKTLKTSILLDAAISLASGKPFLGLIAVQKAARVAVMTGESGLATLQETCRRIAESKGIALAQISGIVFSTRLPRLDNSQHLSALTQYLTEDEIDVLMLDPAYLCMPGDEAGNLFKQGTLLRGLTEACQEAGASIVLCHHNRKSFTNPGSVPELDDIAWAGFAEFARQWWLVGRRTKYQPGTGHHELWLNIGGSAGHSALWALDIDEGRPSDSGGRRWDVSLKPATEAREEARRQNDEVKKQRKLKREAEQVEQAKTAIAASFGGSPKQTKRDLQSNSGINRRVFDLALAEMCREGSVVPASIHRRNGQSYEGFEYIGLA
jgi:RecA-family ATPase